MFVVYDSPLQIFCGNPSQGYMEPAFMELLGALPTTWDTTIILQAKVSDHIITARRKGDDWFMAGMCASEAKDVMLNFPFLPPGSYEAIVCRDGINADRNAMDYVIERSTVQQDGNMALHLAPNGGFLIQLKKK